MKALRRLNAHFLDLTIPCSEFWVLNLNIWAQLDKRDAPTGSYE